MSAPQLSVITEPVHSGKTKSINRVLMDLPKQTQQPTHVRSLNLQEKRVYSVESFTDHLARSSWVTLSETCATYGDGDDYDLTPSTQPPIFVIDQANRLKNLLTDKDGQAALHSLFEWFILNTKEVQKFHVVLISSESF